MTVISLQPTKVKSPTAQQLVLFNSLFRGRTDIYAHRWEKDGRSGYSPAYKFDWEEFLTHKRRGGSLRDFENKSLLPLTSDVLKKHLLGVQVIGIYPILPENTSWFLAADFDGENWKQESTAFINACKGVLLEAYLERSRSGRGGHVWIFFSEPCPCYKIRQIGFQLVRRAFGISEFEKEVSFDRFLPNQNVLPKGGFGNLIALPMQGLSVTEENTIFINIESGAPYPNQWEFLREVKRHSLPELDAVHRTLNSAKSDLSVSVAPTEATLSIIVANQIALRRLQLFQALSEFLKDELNFLNSEYLTKRSLGKSTYQVQKYFKLIGESDDVIFLPRGFLNTLITFLRHKSVRYSVEYERSPLEKVSFKSVVELTPLQNRVVLSAEAQEQGVIVAPAGSGKTIIGLELIARRNLPALILVHRKQILDQWIERIQDFLGIPKSHIGQYHGAKKKLGNQITLALLQSLGRRNDLSDLKNHFGTIIVDECHHIPATTFREVIAKLNPHYLYGLTATPKRKHNDEKLIYVFIGDIIAHMEGVDFKARTEPSKPIRGQAALPPVAKQWKILVRETNLALPFKFSTDLFQLLAKVVCFDTARNQMIVEDILRETNEGHKILVLSERKEHLEILDLYLKGKREIIVVSGDDSARARISKMKQIEDGHYQAVLSTGQFFGEGIDTRGITCLILAFPFSFEGKLVQYVGRLRDIGAQKLIIDYRDRKIPFLERQFRKRERFYRKLCATVQSEDPTFVLTGEPRTLPPDVFPLRNIPPGDSQSTPGHQA